MSSSYSTLHAALLSPGSEEADGAGRTRDQSRELHRRLLQHAESLTPEERGYLVLVVLSMEAERRQRDLSSRVARVEEALAAQTSVMASAIVAPLRLVDEQVTWTLGLLVDHPPRNEIGGDGLLKLGLAVLTKAERGAAGEATAHHAARLLASLSEPTLPMLCQIDELVGSLPSPLGPFAAAHDSPYGQAVLALRSWSAAERETLMAIEGAPALSRAAWYIWGDRERDEIDSDELRARHVESLARNAARVADASAILGVGERRIASLHAGDLEYHSDRLFTRRDVDAVADAAAVLLAADAPGAGERIAEMIAGVSIAPTSAATAPSQSASYALAQQVAQWPTPEATVALGEALARVRHQGLVKRLGRLRQRAVKTLPLRPDVALRMPPTEKPGAAQKRTFLGALQARLASDDSWSIDEWRGVFSGSAWAGAIARGLVFEHRADDSDVWSAFLPVSVDLEDAVEGTEGCGTSHTIDSGAIRLWHPARAEAEERERWREHVWATGLRQPFPQIFREHYVVEGAEAATAFAGFEVDLRPFVGLALSEGWRIDRTGALDRRWERVGAVIELSDSLHPGMQGSSIIRRIRLVDDNCETAFNAVPAAVASEVLRAVDLLVSVTAIDEAASETSYSPVGYRAVDGVDVRRIVLEHIYASEPRVRIEGRRVRVGDYTVHLATARVTLHGDPIPVPEAETVRRSFVASDERVLISVLDAIDHLLAL